ncbi:MAG: hypothetical protein OWU32_03665 [Firmicutes bacterium]|nr:hypothetical protein [Bacillota bacterium]
MKRHGDKHPLTIRLFGTLALVASAALWMAAPTIQRTHSTLPHESGALAPHALDIAVQPNWVTALSHPVVAKFLTSRAPVSDAAPGNTIAAHFLTRDHGYLATESGTILQTLDGGHTWHEILSIAGGGNAVASGTDTDTEGTGTAAASASFDWMRWNGPLAVATSLSIPDSTGVGGQYAVTLTTTDNAGATWSSIQSVLPLNFQTNVGQLQAYPTSATTLWLLTTPQAATMGMNSPVFLSQDGGVHFHAVALPRGFSATGGIAARGGIVALTAMATNGREYAVLATQDSGRTWKMLWSERMAPIYSLLWTADNRLYVAGGNIAKYQQQPAVAAWLLHPQTRRPATRFAWIRGSDSSLWQPIVDLKSGANGSLYALCGGNSMGANLPAPGPLLHLSQTGQRLPLAVEESGTSLSVVGNSVWISGGNEQGGGILESEDGGQTWSNSIQIGDVQAEGVQFLNASTGIVATQVGPYETQNGGKTWHALPLYAASTGAGSWQWQDPLTAMAPTSDGLSLTTNQGRTWQSIPMPVQTPQVEATATLPNGFFAMIYGEEPNYSIGHLATTTDGGRHWTALADRFAGGNATNLTFATPQFGAVYVQGSGAGPGTQILLTRDGGRTWSPMTTWGLRSAMWPLSMTQNGGLFFPAASGPTFSSSGRGLPNNVLAYRAPDGTATAYRLGLHLPTSLDFVTRDDGWIVDLNGDALYHTTNGGTTWTRVWL